MAKSGIDGKGRGACSGSARGRGNQTLAEYDAQKSGKSDDSDSSDSDNSDSGGSSSGGSSSGGSTDHSDNYAW